MVSFEWKAEVPLHFRTINTMHFYKCAGGQETPKPLSQLLSAPQMPLYSRAAANWPPLPDPSGKPHCDSPGSMHASHACGDHSGYGTFLSTGPPVPIIVAAGLPYQGRECMQRDVHGMQSMLHILQYTRDDGPGGRVTLNRKVRLFAKE